MHEPHRHTQTSESITSSGEDQHHYRQHSSGCEGVQGTSVPFQWHGSNRKSSCKLVTQDADNSYFPWSWEELVCASGKGTSFTARVKIRSRTWVAQRFSAANKRLVFRNGFSH